MEIAIVAILIVAGVLFLLAELFLIPGLSVAGVAGFLSLAGAVYYAYVKIGTFAGSLTALIMLAVMSFAVYLFLKSRALDKMSLHADISAKIDNLQGRNIKRGDTGITLSRLAPMGKIEVNGLEAEAKTLEGFIDENTMVRVMDIQGNTVIVETVGSQNK